MARESKDTMRELLGEVNRDFQSFNRDYLQQLRATTPVNTGKARSGWRSNRRAKIGESREFEIANNRVPYIGVLDTGTSKQAPRGIVEPAYNKTRKR